MISGKWSGQLIAKVRRHFRVLLVTALEIGPFSTGASISLLRREIEAEEL